MASEPGSVAPGGIEPAAPGKRRPLLLLIVVAAVVIAGGVGAWILLAAPNNPPAAAFTMRLKDLRVIADGGNSSDPEGAVASYAWDWGDGETGQGRQASHTYADEGPFQVTLTVADTRGAAGSTTQALTITVVPVPHFIARHDRFTVTFNATGSYHALGRNIVSYEWDFGDGGNASGAEVAHTYASAGRRIVTLEVTDSLSRSATTSRYVSPASTTVDIVTDQYFEAGCPYEDYWNARYNTYGDQVLLNTVPCTDYYPWVLFSADVEFQAINPSYVYTLYRWDAKVRNHGAYNISEPVILPVADYGEPVDPNGYVDFDLSMEYLDSALANELRTTPFSVNRKYYADGFGYVLRGNYTMDLATSRRIFGVEATNATEARTWWDANTNASPRNPGAAEAAFQSWQERMGNGKYDIYNGFEWFYEVDFTWLNSTVQDDGTTRVQIFTAGWGWDVLQARWFYWGNSSYQRAVCQQGLDTETVTPPIPCTSTLPYGAIRPAGWSPMETCWCEHATIQGRITNALDLDFVAYQGYHFEAWANLGPDGLARTADDRPAWVFQPYLMDYVPHSASGSNGASGFPNSELRWYVGLDNVHLAPGSYAYGVPSEFLVPPNRWPLPEGSTLTLVMPRFEVPWYDPVRSVWNPTEKIGDYVTFMSHLELRLIRPSGNYYLYDPRANVVSIAGPHSWGVADNVLPLEGFPYIEFGPETTG
ncbi:MAG TPA: PKD domain-containing protein [Thermoplasmata archaeon]|nr:PKD domain-containing protein [Thermoplasmata archaeon]